MTFDGFPPPTKNFFSLPNEMINIIAHITNLAELKVIIYVIRHTWGFHEYGIKKAITTDEFMHGRKRNDDMRMDEGTGLSNRSVIDGLRAAVEHGYLEYELDETDKARKVKSYALKMQASQIDEVDVKKLHMEHDNGYEEPSHQREESSHQREGSSYRTEKNTIERHLEKNKESEMTSTEPTHEDTLPSFSNSSPSLPSDHNQVESLPTENKAVVNPPPFTKQELAERRKWAAYINEDENITREDVLKGLDLYHQWVAAYGIYGKAPWCDKALIWIAQQSNGTWENIQKVYDALPETAINPENVANNWHRLNGKKKASSPKSISGRRRVEDDPAYAEYLASITGGK